MSFHLPRRPLWRAVIMIGSFLLVIVALDLSLVQTRRSIRHEYDTTRIDGPLRPDGSIDYLAAIENHFGSGVTPDNNAAPLLIQALGRIALPSNQPPDGITNRLGMPPLPEKGDYFIRYADFCKQHDAEEEKDPISDANPAWPLVASALTRQWIAANQKPLDLVTQASKRSRFFMPFDGGYRPEILAEVLLPYLGPINQLPRPLLTRALLRLEAGDITGFRDDVFTVHRLARLLGQGSTFLDRVIAGQLETRACQADRTAAASGKLSAAEARSMAAELNALGDLPSFLDKLDCGERLMVLDFLQALARAGPARAGELFNFIYDHSMLPPLAFRFVPVAYEQSMRVMNHFYDGEIAAWRLPTYPQRARANQDWQDEVNRNVGKLPYSLWTGQWPLQTLMPSFTKAQAGETSAIMQRNLAELSLCLSAYKAEHGAYPAALSDLSPAYLKTIPVDLFADRPLTYARTDNGYTLYSVGPDMQDNGGSRSTGDDIVASVP